MTDTAKKRVDLAGKIVLRIIGYALLLLLAIVMILPFYWSIVSSLRPEIENLMGFSLFPKSFTTIHYKNFFDLMKETGAGISLWEILGNTFLIVIVNILTSTLTCALGGYALAHLNLPGQKIIVKLMTASMMLPGIITLIPSYLVVDTLGLTGSFAAVMLPAAFSIYGVLFLRSFFMQTPKEIAEAARIDGAGEFYIFLRIYFPLIVPGLVTLALATFNSNYNAFLWPSLVLAPEQMTIGLALREFQMIASENGAIMAGAVITVIPTLLIFVFIQRFFINNLSFAGIK